MFSAVVARATCARCSVWYAAVIDGIIEAPIPNPIRNWQPPSRHNDVCAPTWVKPSIARNMNDRPPSTTLPGPA
jgi:hypothetical protein